MIEEYGTHDQLMNRNGYYKQTYNQQLIKKEISEFTPKGTEIDFTFLEPERCIDFHDLAF